MKSPSPTLLFHKITTYLFQNKISLSEEVFCRKKCANEVICNQNIWNCLTTISISTALEGG